MEKYGNIQEPEFSGEERPLLLWRRLRVGELAFRELSISLARRGEEYTSIVTGDRSVEDSTDATEKLGIDSNPKAELTRRFDIDFICLPVQSKKDHYDGRPILTQN
jgi:hypothetical protein